MNGKNGTDFVSGLQNAVRENPVSAALVGMGLVWMLTGGSRITAAAALMSPVARGTADGIGQGVAAATSVVSSVADSARSLGESAVEQTRDTLAQAGSSIVDAASGAYDTVKRNASTSNIGSDAVSASNPIIASLKTTFERQPLLLGAIGLAIGTTMAAAFPATRLESEFAGETADRVTQQVKEFASDAVDQVKAAATRAFDAVKDEAASQGLTKDGVKDSVVALGSKVASAAVAARGVKKGT